MSRKSIVSLVLFIAGSFAVAACLAEPDASHRQAAAPSLSVDPQASTTSNLDDPDEPMPDPDEPDVPGEEPGDPGFPGEGNFPPGTPIPPDVCVFQCTQIEGEPEKCICFPSGCSARCR